MSQKKVTKMLFTPLKDNLYWIDRKFHDKLKSVTLQSYKKRGKGDLKLFFFYFSFFVGLGSFPLVSNAQIHKISQAIE